MTRRAARFETRILLTLEAGQSVTGQPSKLPLEAPARITHLADVQLLAHTALVKGKGVYRSRMIPVTNTPAGCRCAPRA